jgi:ABC-2 type transport system ATP-binding protein
MNNAIVIKGLTKSYGTKQVLKGIDLQVGEGEIFALLGVNGAGKTTTLECMEGLRHYQGGEIVLGGRLGVQLQSTALLPQLQALEAIKMFALWHQFEIDMDYLQRLGILEFKHQAYQALSTGQKRRLHLAIAMLGDPDIVVLDEPTAGLDVEGRLALHQEIRAIKAKGKTIIMASHDMAEVEALCDRIAIIKDGSVIFVGDASALRQQVVNRHRIKLYGSGVVQFDHLAGVTLISEADGYYQLEVDSLRDGLLKIMMVVSEQGMVLNDLQVEQVSLEQCFMSLVR